MAMTTAFAHIFHNDSAINPNQIYMIKRENCLCWLLKQEKRERAQDKTAKKVHF